MTFSEGIDEMLRICDKLEEQGVSLEERVALYERGKKIAQWLEDTLAAAASRINNDAK